MDMIFGMVFVVNGKEKMVIDDMIHIKLYEEIDFTDIDDIDDTMVVDFEGFEDFGDFLEENGVLDKFVNNFYKFGDGYTLNYYLIINEEYKEDYIDSAFSWIKTPEGFDFWVDIDYKWRIRNDN
jgi:hypothetical protein